MKEVLSNGENCAWLAQQLKNKMGKYVSFNRFGIANPILTGVYDKNGIGGPYYGESAVRFYIKFCEKEFLRIQIEMDYNTKENVSLVMTELIIAIAPIRQGAEVFELPLAIYETCDCLTCEYAFNKVAQTIDALKNNTLFDDGDIDNLQFFRTYHNGIDGLDSTEENLYGITDSRKQMPEGNTGINYSFEDRKRQNIKILCNRIYDHK